MIKSISRKFGFLHAKNIAFITPRNNMDLGYYKNNILPII